MEHQVNVPNLATDALDVMGGGLLISSAFLPWVRRGPGSSLRGHELVDALLSLRRSAPTSAVALSALWYLIPLCGALNLVRLGLTGSQRAAAVIAVVAIAATTVCGLLIWRAAGLLNSDLGFIAAVAGSAGILAPRIVGSRALVARHKNL